MMIPVPPMIEASQQSIITNKVNKVINSTIKTIFCEYFFHFADVPLPFCARESN